jgi:MFS family permease
VVPTAPGTTRCSWTFSPTSSWCHSRSPDRAPAYAKLVVFVIANDFTALSVAIPNIEHDLETTLTKAQWVINGYALVFGVLIVTGGRLADLLGRKRIFMIGTGIFAVFSLVAGLVPGVNGLIAARMFMGVGGAMSVEPEAHRTTGDLAHVWIGRPEPVPGHPRALRHRHRAHA